MKVKKKVIAVFFIWAVLLVIGSLMGLNDSRIFLVMSFLLTATGMFFGGYSWRRWKKNRK